MSQQIIALTATRDQNKRSIIALEEAIENFPQKHPRVDAETATLIVDGMRDRLNDLRAQHGTVTHQLRTLLAEERNGAAEDLYHKLVQHLNEEHDIELSDEADDALAEWCRLAVSS
jgi:hypothetical protein